MSLLFKPNSYSPLHFFVRNFARSSKAIDVRIKVPQDPEISKIRLSSGIRNVVYATKRLSETMGLPATMEDLKNQSTQYEKISKGVYHREYIKSARKYFFERKSEPNLLTWEMKQQMFNLHAADPMTWDGGSLSEIYPMSSYAIKRVIRKDSLKQLAPEKIHEHDMQVISNWKSLKERKVGNLSLFKKAISARLAEFSQSQLPDNVKVPQVIQDSVENAIFPHVKDEDEVPVPNDYLLLNTKQRKKKQKLLEGFPSFKSIISDRYYVEQEENEAAVKQLEKKYKDELVVTEWGDRDAPSSSYLSSETESGVQIASPGIGETKKSKKRTKRRPWTLDQWLEKKKNKT